MMKRSITVVSLFLIAVTPAFCQFTRITIGPHVSDGRSSQGIAWVDYDRNLDQDIFVTVEYDDVSTVDLLYRNNGDGTFTKITDSPIVLESGSGRNTTWADYNNDGFPDAFVVNQITTSLFENSNGSMMKVAGLPTTDISFDSDHSGAAWADYDNDNDLDLFLSNYALNDDSRNVLYENTPTGFIAVTGSVVSERSLGQDPSWIDFDNNGTMDLFVPNYFSQNLLAYKNNGDKTFTRLTTGMPVQFNSPVIGLAWADYDNDGDFDVAVAVNVNGFNFFYENNGNGTFSVTTNAFTSVRSSSMSWLDFDNDGNIDLMCVGGDGDRTYLFKNNGDKTFTDVSAQQGVNNINYSWGVATGDYNKDGFVDIFIANANGNNLSADDILYRNNGNANRWLAISLEGSSFNRSAIGANVSVFTGTKKQKRTIQSKTGPNSQNSFIMHFGLGTNTSVDSLVVDWPGKGFEVLTTVPSNQFLTLSEPTSYPAKPSNLAGENTDVNQITLNWSDNSADETAFVIHRAEGTANDFKPLAVVDANTTTFSDHVATSGGVFRYRIFAKKGSAMSLANQSSEVPSIITGIEDEISKFKAYPNPLGSTLQIDGSRSAEKLYQIKDLTGSTLKTFNVNGSATVSVEDLAAGVYLLTNGKQTIRIVKIY